jgi:hypothetical protein
MDINPKYNPERPKLDIEKSFPSIGNVPVKNEHIGTWSANVSKLFAEKPAKVKEEKPKFDLEEFESLPITGSIPIKNEHIGTWSANVSKLFAEKPLKAKEGKPKFDIEEFESLPIIAFPEIDES